MKLKVYFFILLIFLVLICGISLFANLKITVWQISFAALLLILCIYLVIFYQKVVRSLQNIQIGMDLLNEQDFSSRLRKIGQYEADKLVDIFNKMMEQLKNERLRLREQNEFLDLLIKASPMGVLVLDFDYRISDINPSALKILGIKDVNSVIKKTLKEISEQVSIDISEIPFDETRTITLTDGTIYKCTSDFFIDKGFQRPFFLIEGLTEEVRRAEKKAYEKVIRMISHEVNNTTAGITSTLDTVEKELSAIPETKDIREIMKVCISRCFGMSKFITNFADVVKIPIAQSVETDLNNLISNSIRFMEVMSHKRNIRIHFDLDENFPILWIDASLFEQVILNIIKNGIESIDNNGDIYIKTVSSAKTLEITDNGKGISKEIENKLFNPFFSTKPTGQGIGLLFVREVLNQHHCEFSLRTYSDGLTRFTIKF